MNKIPLTGFGHVPVDFASSASLTFPPMGTSSQLIGQTIFQVWKENRWQDLPTVRTLFPKSNDVDIAVLETDEKIDHPYSITADDTGGGVTFGQQVWFLGYPFQIMTRAPNGETFPFMKRGSLSAINARDPNAVLIFIDGFNNEGFSGGPVIYWDFKNQKYSLLAVVKGFRR